MFAKGHVRTSADPHAFIFRNGRLSRAIREESGFKGEIIRISPEFVEIFETPPFSEQINRQLIRIDIVRHIVQYWVRFRFVEIEETSDTTYRSNSTKEPRVRLADAQTYLDWRTRILTDVNSKNPSKRILGPPGKHLRSLIVEESRRTDLPFTIELI